MLCCLQKNATPGLSEPHSSPFDAVILAALNAVKDGIINPELQKVIPDPISVDAGKSGSSGTCIIPNPFGGCICHASADYSVSLDTIKGVNALTITDFSSISLSATNLTSYKVVVGAVGMVNDVEADGDAKAGVDACGISPSVTGTASTHARGNGAMQMTAVGSLDLANKCIKLDVTHTELTFSSVSIYDSDVQISLIPGVNIGGLVDLIARMVPEITSAITKAVQGPISNALPGVISKAVPCIPVPV